MTSASDLACTRHGYPSHQAHRMQSLAGRRASSSRMPHGAWNGWYPPACRSLASCWIRGSCDTAGHGYCFDQCPSVGSSPCAPCTW